MKNILETLQDWCTEISPKEFYRAIFPVGSFQPKGEFVTGQYNGIAIAISEKKRIKRFTVTDELDTIDILTASDDFCLMSPISYIGKERKSSNARFMYAMAIDLDGIKLEEYEGIPEGVWVLFWQFDGKGPSNYLPKPTYIVASGTGLHIYYVFKEPIPLYKNIVTELEKLKKRLTWQLWTQGVVNLKENKIQYESLFQGFRIPGTITKVGTRARVFKVDDGTKVDIEYLNKFVPEEYRTANFAYKSKLSLEEAKKKYPEWYEKRVVKGKKKGTWVCKRALYDWWIRQIYAGTNDGHRYWSVMALATYAKKCDISREELEKDALGMVDELHERGKRPDNPFTVDDVLSALEAYNDNYITYPIHTIEARTGILIPRNKRNGRKRKTTHQAYRRGIKKLKIELGENIDWNKGGRPSKQEQVAEWRLFNPNGTKSQCKAETSLTYPTIRKWWDYKPERKIFIKDNHIVVNVPKYLNMSNEEIEADMRAEFIKEMEKRKIQTESSDDND